MSAPVPAPAAASLRPRTWPRLLLAHALQLPAVALVVYSDAPAAWWAAGLWSSAVCCAMTDSLWRWRNRLLVLEAIVWLVLAASLGA